MWDFFDNFFLQGMDEQFKIMMIAIVATVISFTFYSMFTFFWKYVWPKMKKNEKDFEEKIIKITKDHIDQKIIEHCAACNPVSTKDMFNKLIGINKTLSDLREDYARKMVTREDLAEINKTLRECEKEIIKINSYLHLQE